MLPGVLLTILTLLATALSLPEGEARDIAMFMLAWLTFWSVGVIMLLVTVWNSWRLVRAGGSIFGALFITLFSISFIGAEIFGAFVLYTQSGPAFLAVLLLAVVINFAFYHWLKAPTMRGRRFLDEAEGLRMYLEVAEKDVMNFRYPPEKTPELFERLLPYAMALDVEQRWAEKFASVFLHIGPDGQQYQPTWYHGHHWNASNLGAFTSSVGSALTSAIASSSKAPGSSSGGGGGGSSAGGGGGGGGGGW
jgi:uncharacterized membrane protein